MDVFLTIFFHYRIYIASALSANTAIRSATAAAFPLFTVQLYVQEMGEWVGKDDPPKSAFNRLSLIWTDYERIWNNEYCFVELVTEGCTSELQWSLLFQPSSNRIICSRKKGLASRYALSRSASEKKRTPFGWGSNRIRTAMIVEISRLEYGRLIGSTRIYLRHVITWSVRLSIFLYNRTHDNSESLPLWPFGLDQV